MKKIVIDADNNKILETFEEEDTKEIYNRYQNDGRWEDVSIDQGGDIILWKE